MNRLILIAVLLASTAAFADDTKPADSSGNPPAITQPEPAKAAPAPPPTVWVWSDMDQSDINNLSACTQELPKKLADPFIDRIKSHLKAVK